MSSSFLPFPTYLAMIKGSVGSLAYQCAFLGTASKKQEVTGKGRRSCAFFVSAILHFFQWIKTPHLTVEGLIQDMEHSGWKTVHTPKPGDVLVWEPQRDQPNNEPHKHVGFFIGNHRAISNSSTRRVPVAHHWTFGQKNGKPARRVTRILRRPPLAPPS